MSRTPAGRDAPAAGDGGASSEHLDRSSDPMEGGLRARIASSGWVFPALLGLVVALAMVRQGGPIYDDPFILYRYAQHLADGQGWRFNATGDEANAVTSVWSVLVLAGFGGLGFHIPAAASLVQLLTMWGASMATWAALRVLGLRWAAYLAGVLIASSPALTSYWGMESCWVLLLLSMTLYFGCSRRPLPWSALALAAMVLARPDSVLVGGLVVVAFYGPWSPSRPDRRDLLTSAAAFVAPLVLWALVAQVTIGSVLPSTLDAKQAQAESTQWVRYASPSALEGLGRSMGWPLTAVLVLLAAVGVIWSLVRRQVLALTLPLTISGPALVVVYGVVLGIASYPWYYATTVYALIVLAAVGFGRLVALVPPGSRAGFGIGVTLCALLAVVGLAATPTGPSSMRQRYPYLGDWLRRHTDPAASVATVEVGALGWYGERDMVDYLGLLDPEYDSNVAADDFSSWLPAEQPDYWVTTGGRMDASAYGSTCRTRYFELVHRDEPLEVYRRTATIPDTETCVSDASDEGGGTSTGNPAEP